MKFWLFASITLLLVGNSCSLRAPGAQSSIQIRFPADPSIKEQTVSRSGNHSKTQTEGVFGVSSEIPGVPSSLSDFNCFGVLVSGPGIQADPRFQCPSTTDSLGEFGGFASTKNGSVNISVSQGTSRLFQVFGYKGSSCPSLDQVLTAPGVTPLNALKSLPPFFVIGSATADISQSADSLSGSLLILLRQCNFLRVVRDHQRSLR